MSGHVLLNLLNKLRKRDKMRDSRVIARSFDKSGKLMILQQNLNSKMYFSIYILNISEKQNVFFYIFILIFIKSFKTDKDFPCSTQYLHGSLKITPAKI